MDYYTPTAADLERFWSRVTRGEPAACWPWTAGTNSRGYGRIRWNGHPESANRIVWMLTYGPIPNQQRVLPSCDNPRCCNPAHLTLAARHAPMHRRTVSAGELVEPADDAPATQPPIQPPAPTQRGPVVSQLRAEIAQLRAEIQQLKEHQP